MQIYCKQVVVCLYFIYELLVFYILKVKTDFMHINITERRVTAPNMLKKMCQQITASKSISSHIPTQLQIKFIENRVPQRFRI